MFYYFSLDARKGLYSDEKGGEKDLGEVGGGEAQSEYIVLKKTILKKRKIEKNLNTKKESVVWGEPFGSLEPVYLSISGMCKQFAFNKQQLSTTISLEL